MGLQYTVSPEAEYTIFFRSSEKVSIPSRFMRGGAVSGKNYFHKTFFMLKSLICKIFQEGGYEQKGKQAENIFCP